MALGTTSALTGVGLAVAQANLICLVESARISAAAPIEVSTDYDLALPAILFNS